MTSTGPPVAMATGQKVVGPLGGKYRFFPGWPLGGASPFVVATFYVAVLPVVVVASGGFKPHNFLCAVAKVLAKWSVLTVTSALATATRTL